MASDVQKSVLLTTFHSGKKRIKVILHQGNIVWDNEKPPSAQKTLPIENIISVDYNYMRNHHPIETKEIDPYSFTIHYAVRENGPKWVYKKLSAKHSDPLQVSSWVKTLQNYLQISESKIVCRALGKKLGGFEKVKKSYFTMILLHPVHKKSRLTHQPPGKTYKLQVWHKGYIPRLDAYYRDIFQNSNPKELKLPSEYLNNVYL